MQGDHRSNNAVRPYGTGGGDTFNRNRWAPERADGGDKSLIEGEGDQREVEKTLAPEGSSQTQSREAQYVGPYIVVPPDEAKRSQLQRIAAKELEDLERWKAEHKPGPINLAPAQLGGRISEAEARRKQQIDHLQSKYEKKQKREEYQRKRKEEEEAEIQKQKAIQREKANKLEEKRKQEEVQRREQFKIDQYCRNEDFLSRMSYESPARCSTETSTRSSKPIGWGKIHSYKEAQKEEETMKLQKMKEEQRRKSELLEQKQRQKEEERLNEQQKEHRRVNRAFLDRLEAKAHSAVINQGHHSKENNLQTDGANSDSFVTHRKTSLQDEDSSNNSYRDESEDQWNITKLQSAFPYYERSVLEDILQQCNGDCDQAYQLLQ